MSSKNSYLRNQIVTHRFRSSWKRLLSILQPSWVEEGGQLPMCPPVITHVYSYRAETEIFPPRAYGRNMWKVHTEIFFVTTQHLADDMFPSQFTVEKQRSLMCHWNFLWRVAHSRLTLEGLKRKEYEVHLPFFYQVEICNYDRISLLWEDFISQPSTFSQLFLKLFYNFLQLLFHLF